MHYSCAVNGIVKKSDTLSERLTVLLRISVEQILHFKTKAFQ